MKPYYRGVLGGIFISAIIAVLYVNGLFGEPNSYNATYLRLENDNPSVFIDTLDTRIDFTNGDPSSGLTTPAPLSLYTSQTLLDVTDADVAQVCIARAVLDQDGAEDWLARIRLKDTSIFNNTAGALGFARWGNPSYTPSIIRLGRYKKLTPADSVNRLPGHAAFDIYMSFNEKDLPNTSILLLQLSPKAGVQPCDPDMDTAVYNRWKAQWNNSSDEPVYLSDEYKY